MKKLLKPKIKKKILRKDGIIQSYYVNASKKDVKTLRPKKKDYYSIQPSKGGGVAFLGDDKKVKNGLEILRNLKVDPPKYVVKYIGNGLINAFKNKYGEKELNNINSIIIPPITKGKDGKRTLNYKVAEYISNKLNKQFLPYLFPPKDFELKKLPYSQRINKLENFVKNSNIDFNNVGNAILIDDIILTGTTNKVLKDYFNKHNKKLYSLVIFKA